MAEQANGGSETSSVESFTDSWIQLDSKNGSSLQNSPKFSDDEEMEEVLADAQAESARSTTRSKKPTKEHSEEKANAKAKKSTSDISSSKSNMYSNVDVKKTKNSSFFESSAFFISSLIVSHTLVFVLGIVVGRRYFGSTRSL